MRLPDLKNIRLNKKYVRIAGVVLVVIFVLLLIGSYIAYTKREAMLQSAITKAKAKAKSDYNLDLEIGSARFTGLSTVDFTDITIVPYQRDSLLTIKNFEVNIKISPLLFGKVELANVIMQNGHLNLTDINHVKNFDFIFKKKKDTTDTKKINLSDLSYNLINQVLYKIPDNLDMSNFLVSFKTDSSSFRVLTKTATIKDGELSSTIDVNNGAATWHFAGRMRASHKDIDIKLYADGKKVQLPYVDRRYHLKVNFDTLSTRLTSVEQSGGETRFYGYWGVSNLVINQPGLSSSDIVLPNASIDAKLFIGSNYVSVDSSSVITLKKIIAHPYVKYTLSPVKIYELKVNTGWTDAQDFFDSLPAGIFDSLEGIQVGGKLDYKLNIFLNSSDPNNVQFDSRLNKDDFRVIRYGKVDFSKLNGSFTYTPYEYGKAMPSRTIGPSNPYFTPLTDISPNLQYAVMTAEDPSFYSNNGFVEESFRKSLATDFQEKKFKRGGSTISMQLVKNAFLSREKTVARKAEEMLIVWMIQNDRIMTKDRMLEVYFNIIEWGNNVYGIGEAARYYFNKTPSELTIGESIYLASIVPHPKTGLYSFLPNGSLRPGLVGYFNLIGNLMAGHGRAQQDSSGYGFYSVRLKESLRKEAPADTAMADSLIKHDKEENGDDALPAAVPQPVVKKPNFIQRIFGKKDSVPKKEEPKAVVDPKVRLKAEIQKLRDDEDQKELLIDTAGKTRKQIRQEKRRMRSDEKDQEKALKNAVQQ